MKIFQVQQPISGRSLFLWADPDSRLAVRYGGVAYSGNDVRRINKCTLYLARLILGWVTVFGGQTPSVFNQATQANSASYPQRDGK